MHTFGQKERFLLYDYSKFLLLVSEHGQCIEQRPYKEHRMQPPEAVLLAPAEADAIADRPRYLRFLNNARWASNLTSRLFAMYESQLPSTMNVARKMPLPRSEEDTKRLMHSGALCCIQFVSILWCEGGSFVFLFVLEGRGNTEAYDYNPPPSPHTHSQRQLTCQR